jgi:1,4-dihydroxy-6-naphthoate synthase
MHYIKLLKMPVIDIGFSPCPNDTFIFDALVNHKIDTKGYTFNTHLEDVQTLNEWAIQGKLPFSKISYGVWPLVKNNYHVLNAGGALGKGVGPLLIYKETATSTLENDGKPTIETMSVALPGMNTTAHLLFSLAFPKVKNKKFLLFNEIEDAVLNVQVDAGVIIHENRFTYLQKGLTKWMDLGTYFEETFNAPIPLGGIIARKDMPNEEVQLLDSLIKESVQYAFKNSYDLLPEFVKCHAQEMSEQVMRQHIDLYVNDFTVDMGDTGKKAIEQLEKVWSELNG